MSAPRPVVIAAGGTGGHVVPAIGVAQALAGRGVPVVWIGTAEGLEASLVPAAGIELRTVEVRGLRGKGALDRALGPVRLARAVRRSAALLAELRPRAVLGMGGYVSGPVGIAARLARVPLVLHEQNAVAGLTNRTLARVATRTFAAFPGAFGARVDARTVGNPVTDAVAALAQRADAHDDAAHGADRPLALLVVGGSRGAAALNEALPGACAALARAGVALAVRHQAGAGRGAAVREAYARALADTGGTVEAAADDFIDDMPGAYDGSDLVVARSGAMTVTELAAVGRAAILVPYPHAVDDHQSANARWLVEAGGALLMPQPLDPVRLADEIARLAADRGALRAMGRAARARFVPEAAERVADALLELSGGAAGPSADASGALADAARVRPVAGEGR